MQNFGVTNKEHYGMLWYFLEWSITDASLVLHACLWGQRYHMTRFSKLPDNTVIDSDSSWEEPADEGPINPIAETKRLGTNLSLSPKKLK